MKPFSGFRKLALILNAFPALGLLLACFIAYYPIDSLPLLDVFGLLVPMLVIFNLIFLVYWGLLRNRYFLISIPPLLLGYLCFGGVYQFHTDSDAETKEGISILTYNVQDFNSYRGKAVSDSVSTNIISFIKEYNPDILSFQEFSRRRARNLAHYPYKYQTPYNSSKTIQAIFSKYPIIGSGSLEFPNSQNNALFADIVIKGDTMRVYNIHLQSFQIHSFRSIVKRNLGIGFLRRLQYTASKHQEQAAILNSHREASPYPSIICGDFNQTPYSPSFIKLKRGMQDSFREKGQGWGTTFMRNIISARIDFILADEQAFEILEHRNFDLRLSDHLPVMARLQIRSD